VVHGVTETVCLGVELGNNVIDPSKSGFEQLLFIGDPLTPVEPGLRGQPVRRGTRLRKARAVR
jgi:hypothetical protein